LPDALALVEPGRGALVTVVGDVAHHPECVLIERQQPFLVISSNITP
jgi:hypothetical protein